MDAVLSKLKLLMEEHGKEVAELPPCVELEISLLRLLNALKHTRYSCCSPFVGEADLEEDEREGSLAKVKNKPTAHQQEERGLTSLVNTTLHGDCCPLIMYRMVSVCVCVCACVCVQIPEQERN